MNKLAEDSNDLTWADPANRNKARILAQIIATTGLATGVGAGARGLLGLMQTSSRSLKPPPKTHRQRVLQIPVPYLPSETKSANLFSRLLGGASGDPPANAYVPPSSPLEGLSRDIAQAAGLTKDPDGKNWNFAKDWLVTHGPAHWTEQPWTYAQPPLVMGGLYGGWKLTDSLLNASKKREEQRELTMAKADYAKAMRSQYASGEKRSSATSAISRLYDAVCGETEKQAYNLAGPYLGSIGLMTLATTLAAGRLGYNHATRTNPAEAIQDAMKLRQVELENLNPIPIVARPVLVPTKAKPRRAETIVVGDYE